MPYLIQRAAAAALLVLLAPLILGLAMLVRLASRGPAFHSATRVGRHGQPFRIHKLRSMAVTAGSRITAASDRRVTRLGRLLRRTKLDELPQLLNVARGEMALFGPRPEDPRFVDPDDARWQTVLTALPGMTGPAALEFADEEHRLAEAAMAVADVAGRAMATDADIEAAYRTSILPAKLALDVDYVRTRSVGGDLRILARTIGLVLGRVGGS